MNGETTMERGPAKRTTPKRQLESTHSDAVAEWGKAKGGKLLRNRRGMVTLPNGGKMQIGWGPNGTGDRLGYLPVRITPAMVNKVLPVFAMIEVKTDAGRLEPHQLAIIEEYRDVNAISGCARNAQDCEAILANFIAKVCADER